jgi:hypothetical protein
MPRHQRLDPPAPWVEVIATDSGWDAADPAPLTSMLGHLVLIRAFEEYVLDLAREGSPSAAPPSAAPATRSPSSPTWPWSPASSTRSPAWTPR